MDKIIVVAGPTCVGKTEYAVKLAQILNGEIVSCDSMQIYKYMDIGSAKPSKEELKSAKHHLVDFVDPAEKFSVAEYQKVARKAIKEIINNGKIPIVSGGTGLYLNSLLYDMDFSGADSDMEYRKELEETAKIKGSEYLHDMLKKLSSDKAREIHPNNLKKIIRALEIIKITGEEGRPFSQIKEQNSDFEAIIICLNREREDLYERINKRVDILIKKGLIEEVSKLKDMGLSYDDISMKGIGYKEIIAYLNNEYDLRTAVESVKKNTRRYAKRQITWFKRYKNARWFDISGLESDEIIRDILSYLKETGIYVG